MLESPLGIMTTAPTTTPVASVTQRGSLTLVASGNQSVAIASVLSGLDSIVKTIPTLREMGRAVGETNAKTTPTAIARLEKGQTLFLDGGRRLTVVADRLVLMNGTQYVRSWPAASSRVMKTGDQFISVLEQLGYTI